MRTSELVLSGLCLLAVSASVAVADKEAPTKAAPADAKPPDGATVAAIAAEAPTYFVKLQGKELPYPGWTLSNKPGKPATAWYWSTQKITAAPLIEQIDKALGADVKKVSLDGGTKIFWTLATRVRMELGTDKAGVLQRITISSPGAQPRSAFVNDPTAKIILEIFDAASDRFASIVKKDGTWWKVPAYAPACMVRAVERKDIDAWISCRWEKLGSKFEAIATEISRGMSDKKRKDPTPTSAQWGERQIIRLRVDGDVLEAEIRTK